MELHGGLDQRHGGPAFQPPAADTHDNTSAAPLEAMTRDSTHATLDPPLHSCIPEEIKEKTGLHCLILKHETCSKSQQVESSARPNRSYKTTSGGSMYCFSECYSLTVTKHPSTDLAARGKCRSPAKCAALWCMKRVGAHRPGRGGICTGEKVL